jgi:hypothetical protein
LVQDGGACLDYRASMSNTKRPAAKGANKPGGRAPDAPVIEVLDTPAAVERTFANAWTVDVTRAAADSTQKRALALAVALREAPPAVAECALAVLGAYAPTLDGADAVLSRDTRTPKERELRKPWQSRVAGVGIVAHGLRATPVAGVEDALVALLSQTSSALVREEILNALLGDEAIGTRSGGLAELAAFIEEPGCTDVALLRAGFRSLFKLDAKRARARWEQSLASAEEGNPRSLWLARIALEEMEAQQADVGTLCRVVFPWIKAKKGPVDDLRVAAVRYSGLSADHYLALVEYVSERDDDWGLVETVADRFAWASLGSRGVKQEQVRPLFKTLEKRYRERGDTARTGVFTKLLGGLVREQTA